ncbi:MAG: acyltransferase [Prevotella sp.]|nr:acyltransferase [Prevotella sp.]
MLSRTECTAMRGLAIVAIMLHNYCHFVAGIVQENEYLFRTANNERLWQALTHPDVLLPVHLLSYFGHYGVPLFLFLSGYGLVLKYEAPENGTAHSVGALTFLRQHYQKLLRLLVVGFVLFVVVDTLTPGRFHFQWQHVMAQFAMLINFLPTPNKIIWPGIYWFFGMIMQVYLVYRLLLYRRSSALAIAIVVLCWLPQACCQPDGEVLNWLRYNFVGAMLPFCAGILLARHGHLVALDRWPRWAWLLVWVGSTALLPLLCLSFQSWLWAPLAVIVAAVGLVRCMPSLLMRLMVFFGTLSAPIFVAHPAARKLLIGVAFKDGVYDGLLLYIIVTLGLSWAVMQVLQHLNRSSR